MEGVTNEQFRGIIKMIIKEIESISDADSKRKVLEKLEALINEFGGLRRAGEHIVKRRKDLLADE